MTGTFRRWTLAALLQGCTLMLPTADHQSGDAFDAGASGGPGNGNAQAGVGGAEGTGDDPSAGEATSGDAGGDGTGDGSTDRGSAGPEGCPDADHDGFADMRCGGEDCDDSRATVHPNAPPVCGDGVENDCAPDSELMPLLSALYAGSKSAPEIGRLPEVRLKVPGGRGYEVALALLGTAGAGVVGWVDDAGHRLVRFDLRDPRQQDELPALTHLIVTSLDLKRVGDQVVVLALLKQTTSAFALAGPLSLTEPSPPLTPLSSSAQPEPSVRGRAVVVGGALDASFQPIAPLYVWSESAGSGSVIGGVDVSLKASSYRSTEAVSVSVYQQVFGSGGPHVGLWKPSAHDVLLSDLTRASAATPATWQTVVDSTVRPALAYLGQRVITGNRTTTRYVLVGRSSADPARVFGVELDCEAALSCALAGGFSAEEPAPTTALAAAQARQVRLVAMAGDAVRLRAYGAPACSGSSTCFAPTVGSTVQLSQPDDTLEAIDLRLEVVEHAGVVSIISAAQFQSEVRLSGLRACEER